MYGIEKQGDFMSDYGFELGGLEELAADIQQCLKDYPEETSKKAYNLSGKFTKDVNKKFPGRYNQGKRPLSKNWEREREKTLFTGYTIRINVSNKSPHFHLVENGHELYISPERYAAMKAGKITFKGAIHHGKRRTKDSMGMVRAKFVPGKHYCERTRNEWKEKYPQLVEKFVDKMLKDHKL